MALTWTGWKHDPTADPESDDFLTPYMAWYLMNDLRARSDQPLVVSQRNKRTEGQLFEFALPDLPLPKKALSESCQKATELPVPKPRKTVLDGLSQPPGAKDVIIGIVDAGLALSHERFRRAGGIGTRILSHWAQGGTWAGQEHLPFGRELMQKDIDDLMGGASEVDEGAFNRKAGLVDFADPLSERWIETSAPHGTHVADLAAGCDPLIAADDPRAPGMAEFRDRTHLILVDLAPRISIGSSGSFLETYVIWAIRHIVATADAIWNAAHPDHARKGYPIVINLSYGLQAGPKDGSMDVQKFVRALNNGRHASAPVRLVISAGNENLERASAVLGQRNRDVTRSLDWRIQPEDRTSSYVEVWSDPPEETGSTDKDSFPGPISVTPPAETTTGFPTAMPKPGQVCDLEDTQTKLKVARVYCRRVSNTPDMAAPGSIGYVICAAPTWRAQSAAPAGAWRITLGEGPLAKLYVQSDQQVTPTRGGELMSYFEDVESTEEIKRYQPFDPDTRPRDSFTFDYESQTVTDNEPLFDDTGPIRRQNTVNAIGLSTGWLTIGGYRASDGWPAPYSATARGFPLGNVGDPGGGGPGWLKATGGKGWMEAACISDDGTWRFGRLAAGTRSGSVAAMQGTSFATGEATRIVAGMLLDWVKDWTPQSPEPARARHFERLAQSTDAAIVQVAAGHGVIMPPAADLKTKLGAGRLPRQAHGRVPR